MGVDVFQLDQGLEILDRTPGILRSWLSGLSEDWVRADEGPDTWSAYDVVGHLIHGERTDWIPRVEHILEGRGEEPFHPFDRLAHEKESAGKSLEDLLSEFVELRGRSLETLRGFGLGKGDLDLPGTHPAFGKVTLGQLLAAWVTHDLGHLAQIARAMAKRNAVQVGPWKQYLSILNWK